ncbi:MAG TPA: hypothetical protein PLP75_04190 [Burkholderiales bacterium]|nr:hypothetical protein [Burkholderiales bacterium]
MFNQQTWSDFWDKLQQDTADTLQNNILNFSTLVAGVSAYIKVFHPQYSEMANDMMLTYLTVLPKVKS